MKNKNKDFLNIDISLFSHESLVEVIKQLENSGHVALRKKAQRELVRRLKDKGFSNKKIAMILISNVYGKRKRLAIAREWAEALGISKEEFLTYR